MFHTKCLEKWYEKSRTCPLCRTPQKCLADDYTALVLDVATRFGARAVPTNLKTVVAWTELAKGDICSVRESSVTFDIEKTTVAAYAGVYNGKAFHTSKNILVLTERGSGSYQRTAWFLHQANVEGLVDLVQGVLGIVDAPPLPEDRVYFCFLANDLTFL